MVPVPRVTEEPLADTLIVPPMVSLLPKATVPPLLMRPPVTSKLEPLTSVTVPALKLGEGAPRPMTLAVLLNV